MLQRFVHVHASREPGRRDPEQNSGREAQPEREKQNAGIEMDLATSGKIRRRKREQRVESPLCQEDAGCAASDREHDAFGQQLADESAATRAEGVANGNFVMTRGRASEEEVR